MACAKLSTCNCLCTKVDVTGLTYNGIGYNAGRAYLLPEGYPALGCSCVLSGVAKMPRTANPAIRDNLTIRVELHDNCIMYAEATLAVSGTPVWSGRCTTTLNCVSGRFSCGAVGGGGIITMQSRSVYGNSFNLVIDGDPCESQYCDDCDINCDGGVITMVVSGATGSPACTDLNGIYTLAWASTCQWSGGNGSGGIGMVVCTGGVWEVSAWKGMFICYRNNSSAVLACTGDHPAGSGVFTALGDGSWTLS